MWLTLACQLVRSLKQKKQKRKFGAHEPQPQTVVNRINMKAPPRNKIDGLPEATMKIGQGGQSESVFYGKLLNDQMNESTSKSTEVQTMKQMDLDEITNCLKSDLKEYDKHALLVKINGRTTRSIPWGDIFRDLGISEVSCRRSWDNTMNMRRSKGKYLCPRRCQKRCNK